MVKRKTSSREKAEVRPGRGPERYRSLLDEEEYTRLLQAVERPLPHGIRINLLKTDPDRAGRTWPEWYGWEIEPVPYCPSGWQVHSFDRRLSQTPEYKLGYYFIQDAASMLPVELFDFAGLDHPLILDMAAAPGGKTTHLADRTRDRGLVIANDSSPSRLSALRAVLQDWGALNAAVTGYNGELFGGWYPEVFDRVLLDAPCSMENLRPEEGRSLRPVSARERSGLADRQIRLLASGFRALKPGGHLVYSTCTLAPEEDEAVLDALLRTFPNEARVESVHDRLPEPAPALTQYGETVFDPQVSGAVRLWPHRFRTSGFFAARISKTASTGNQSSAGAPYRSMETTGLVVMIPAARKAFLNSFLDTYGYDLDAVLEDQQLSLWKRGEAIHAIPDALLRVFPGLPVHSAGLVLGEETPGGFVPSHELVARFGRHFQRNKLHISTAEAERWMTGQDIHLPPENVGRHGSILILVDERGRLLGRGKRLNDRIRNLLPRWLLR